MWPQSLFALLLVVVILERQLLLLQPFFDEEFGSGVTGIAVNPKVPIRDGVCDNFSVIVRLDDAKNPNLSLELLPVGEVDTLMT